MLEKSHLQGECCSENSRTETHDVTYQKFDCFSMCEFSQIFETFCLNSRATKFYPNLLASHLKLCIKLKHIKIIFKLWYKCELEFSWILFGV
jgi:hypothetical protein